jgi:hypothetical protein
MIVSVAGVLDVPGEHRRSQPWFRNDGVPPRRDSKVMTRMARTRCRSRIERVAHPHAYARTSMLTRVEQGVNTEIEVSASLNAEQPDRRIGRELRSG